MEYNEAVKKINSLIKFGIKPGLDRMKKLLNLIGNPEKNLNIIHVAGTNGKGSICSMTASILINSGYKTGLFISPNVTSFRERMQINGCMISKKDISLILNDIFPFVQEMARNEEIITEFELITAIALRWFADNNCDLVVLEVGLGGRLDATNVIENPLVSVITSISVDHTNILGNNLEDIAYEKCGIIKEGGITISYPEQVNSVKHIIEQVAEDKHNELIIPSLSKLVINKMNLSETSFIYDNEIFELSLLGEHQIKNAITVLSIIDILNVKGFRIKKHNVLYGLKHTIHPARFEVISDNPTIILDGAHNVDGMKSLLMSLKKYLPGKKIIGIVGMLKDKDIDNSIKTIAPILSKIVAVTPQNPRALPADMLAQIAKRYCKNVESLSGNLSQVISVINMLIDSDCAVVVFGSLYLLSDVRNILKSNL